MLPAAKKTKLFNDLKNYKKKFIVEKYFESDESATRLMINSFLTDILGFKSLDEVKTEYMIKGTYADYVIQLDGKRHFLVEVKAMQIDLSDKHLRQAVNYAANEGIDWALLTNGKDFELYRVYFTDKVESRKVFSACLSEMNDIKNAVNCIQYLTKAAIQKKGLDILWNKVSALDPPSVASLLYSKKIISILKKELKTKYKTTFSEEDIANSITRIIEDKIENVKPIKEKKSAKDKVKSIKQPIATEAPVNEILTSGQGI
jgi:predicted type IV restriction endonuclease